MTTSLKKRQTILRKICSFLLNFQSYVVEKNQTICNKKSNHATLYSKVLALPSPSKACMQYIFLLTIIFKFNYLFFNLQQPTTIFESIKSARAFGITIRLLNISVNSQTKSLEIKLPSIIKMSAIII